MAANFEGLLKNLWRFFEKSCDFFENCLISFFFLIMLVTASTQNAFFETKVYLLP